MFKYFVGISILAIILSGGCSEEIDLPLIPVLGHGGAGFVSTNNPHMPNTRRSIERAVFFQGADGVEVDIQLTKDGRIVLYHDNRLETSTNKVGYISQKTSEELRHILYRGSLDHGRKDSLLFLFELFDLLNQSERNIVLSLNIQTQKEVENQAVYQNRFREVLALTLSARQNLNVLVECPDRDFLEVLSKPFQGSFPVDLYYDAEINQSNIDFCKQHNLSGLVTKYYDEDESTMKLARAEDLSVVFYGLKIRKDIRLALEMGPDMVQTDNIPLTLNFLGR